jgi:hypothetical protein
MSWKDMDVAVDSELEGLTAPAKMLWCALARHRNGTDGACYPKLETLMKKTCLCRSAVQRNIQLLVELGVISAIPGSGRRASHYKLLICHNDDVSESGVDESIGPSELPLGPLKATSGAAQIPVRGSSEGLESGREERREKRESEVRSIDRSDPAELVSGDKTSSSSSSVEYPPPERLARLVLYSLLEHDKSDVSYQSPVYLRAVGGARPFLLTHDVEEAKRYLKLIKEDVNHRWFDFIKAADFPVAYFASAFPKIKEHYDTKAPVSKAQPNTKAAEKKETRDTTTNPFTKWQKKEIG